MMERRDGEENVMNCSHQFRFGVVEHDTKMTQLKSGYISFQRGSRVGTTNVSNNTSQNAISTPLCRKFIGDPMDRYLARIGLVKKMMPNDKGSSVFRAVCESLSMDQSEYLDLKQIVEEELLLRYRLQRLRTGLPAVNRLEDTLETITRLLRIDIHVYRNVGEQPQIYRCPKRSKKRPDKVMLCETARGHYDMVYPLKDHVHLAYAQTIIYNFLYVHTFGFSPATIKESIDRVRADMDAIGTDIKTPSPFAALSSMEQCFSFRTCDIEGKQFLPIWRPPIPYSAVKALDPSVYRNVAYDVFSKDRRRALERIGLSLLQQEFHQGTRCYLMEEESLQEAIVLASLDRNSRLIAVGGKEKKVKITDLVPYSQPVPVGSYHNSSTFSERGRDTKESVAAESGVESSAVVPSPTYATTSTCSIIPFFEYNFCESLTLQYGQYAVPIEYMPQYWESVSGNDTYELYTNYASTLQINAQHDSHLSRYYGLQSAPVQISESVYGFADGGNHD
ncbi:hypothetical protein RB195_009196 [Necator americanus]|uniref:Uncharacterized protein n=1 Tax=Necator americanus TaxID=51031 RepID=A0ABR1CS81_NECAM